VSVSDRHSVKLQRHHAVILWHIASPCFGRSQTAGDTLVIVSHEITQCLM
jgi:hypothetical protein